MTTYAGVTVDVLEALGLDPAAAPLFEWQTLGPAEPVAPTIIHVGDTTLSAAGGDKTHIDLPAGTEAGDLLVLTIGAGGLAGSMPTCVDARMVISQQYPSANINAHLLVGYGIADDSGDPLTITLHDGEANGGATLTVYRVTGTITTVVANGNLAGGDDVPFEIPIPDDAALAVLALAGHFVSGPVLPDWTRDGSQHGANTYAQTFRSAGVPVADTYSSGWWLALTIGFSDVDPEGDVAWNPDPDRSRSLISYALSYGRADATSKVPPTQITIKAAIPRADPPEIGDLFRIALTAGAADALGLTEDEAARFTGEVTDVQIDPESRTWTVIGVHQEARQGRTVVDLTATAPATLHDRVGAVLARIGATAGAIDAGGQVLATPDAPATGSGLLDLASDSAPGQVVTQLHGVVDWHSRDHRRGAISALTLTASEILSAITWAKRVGSLVNVATINYASGSVVVTDHASADARGEYPITVTTSLVDRDDALSLGTLIVGRRASPAWDLPTLQVDPARTVDPDHLAALLRLRHSTRLTVDGLPDNGGPVVGDAEFYAEGFTDTGSRFSWRLALAVTDPALSGVSIRWMDVDPDLEWLAVHPEIRWIDVARIEDPALLGTPVFVLDGGDAATTPTGDTYDGGDASTSSFTRTIDGGLAA